MSEWKLILGVGITAICLWFIPHREVLAESMLENPLFQLPDEETLERLLTGEIVIENNISDENGAAASVLIFVHGPVEKLWSVITTCTQVEIFVDGLKFCQVLEEQGDYALTRQVVDKGWASPRIDYTFETHRIPFTRMQFQLTDGNLKTMQGSWDFKNHPNGVLVRHRLVLRPLLPVPRWLVRRIMKKDLPNMLACVRGLADGGSSPEAQRQDILKCPNRKNQTGRSR